MIYILKKENLVYITESPRKENEKEGRYEEELLYTFEDLSITKELKQQLRPWNCFWLEDENYYRLEILQHLNYILDNKSGCKKYVEMYESEKTNYLNSYLNALSTLNFIKKLSLNGYSKIKYHCDVYNILSVEFGEDNVKKAQKFIKLKDSDKKFLTTFNSFSNKNKKLEYARSYTGYLPDLFEFLPNYIKEDFFIFDSKLINSDSRQPHPFLDQSPLENIQLSIDLKNLIYSNFILGNYYTGPEIKSILTSIYNSLDIKQTPKIQDLYDFFNITKSNANSSSSYRLDTRKII